MTTSDGGNEITAMDCLQMNLDLDIKNHEQELRRKIESLKTELDRTLRNLDQGYRVNSLGVAAYPGLDIDRECAILNELYDRRIQLNAALAHDEKAGAK